MTKLQIVLSILGVIGTVLILVFNLRESGIWQAQGFKGFWAKFRRLLRRERKAVVASSFVAPADAVVGHCFPVRYLGHEDVFPLFLSSRFFFRIKLTLSQSLSAASCQTLWSDLSGTFKHPVHLLCQGGTSGWVRCSEIGSLGVEQLAWVLPLYQSDGELLSVAALNQFQSSLLQHPDFEEIVQEALVDYPEKAAQWARVIQPIGERVDVEVRINAIGRRGGIALNSVHALMSSRGGVEQPDGSFAYLEGQRKLFKVVPCLVEESASESTQSVQAVMFVLAVTLVVDAGGAFDKLVSLANELCVKVDAELVDDTGSQLDLAGLDQVRATLVGLGEQMASHRLEPGAAWMGYLFPE